MQYLLPTLPSSPTPERACSSIAAVADACAARLLSADADFWSLFEEQRSLGRGCFGTVLLIRPREQEWPTGAASRDCAEIGEHLDCAPSSSVPLAVKVVMADDAVDALHEAAILRSLCHPNLVTLHDVYASPSTIFVLMGAELGGDLNERTQAAPGGVLTEAEARQPLSCVLAALLHLHVQHGIVHRDVKASNVMLAADGVTAKLGDFGLAARLPAGGRLTSVCGTHDFLAPEMIRTGHGECTGYGCEVDMWAYGLMLHAVLLGTNPFERDTDIATLQAILDGEYSPPADGRISHAVCHLLGALLVTDPSRRLSAEEATGHVWLRAALKAADLCSPAGVARRPRNLISRLWARAG